MSPLGANVWRAKGLFTLSRSLQQWCTANGCSCLARQSLKYSDFGERKLIVNTPRKSEKFGNRGTKCIFIGRIDRELHQPETHSIAKTLPNALATYDRKNYWIRAPACANVCSGKQRHQRPATAAAQVVLVPFIKLLRIDEQCVWLGHGRIVFHVRPPNLRSVCANRSNG